MQPQYRNYPLAAQAGHHATPTRRGPAPIAHPSQYPPPQQQQHSNAHLIAQQRADQEKRDRLRRMAKTPTNKNVPEGVEDVCIGDGVARYKELREVERILDATMMRKKLEASDSVFHTRSGRSGTMRIWISNTAENQPWQSSGLDADAFDFDSDTNATYRVKIQGRLLDELNDEGLEEDDDEKDPDAMDADADVDEKTDSTEKPKPFSQFFSAITIDFDRAKSLQPDNFTQIEWKRPEGANPQDNPFSQIEFERKGDENINITINLQRHQSPEIFRLSKPMAELLDTDEEDRASVLMGVWEYARAQNLQQDEDERKFACDSKLKALFGGADSFYFPSLPQLIKPHLTTLPPVQLQYTIRVDKDYLAPSPESGKSPSEPTVYDVQVTLDDPLQPLLHSILRSKQSTETLQQIHNIDDQIVLLMSAISRSKAKHAFFTSMATDPVAFVKRWFSSQKRDLEVILGDAARGGGEDASGEEWKQGGADSVWASETARESVALWLARPNVPKAH
ncbi:SWI/SNF and RSC complex subunit Ssr3 [Kalmusia sp. IMI 367209]|nr:SWI/SNF and RSC complex subunit Ssr3 [Kalmusia sp. IMI 367209]